MFSNILVAYDGSSQANRAADAARRLAAKFDARLHLLHVVDHAHAPEAVSTFARTEHVNNPEALEEHAAGVHLLGPVERQAHDDGVTKVEARVLRGDPSEELLRYARDAGIDMIVMGRRGLGRVEGLLMGSVSAKIASHADCPVLTVK